MGELSNLTIKLAGLTIEPFMMALFNGYPIPVAIISLFPTLHLLIILIELSLFNEYCAVVFVQEISLKSWNGVGSLAISYHKPEYAAKFTSGTIGMSIKLF